MEASESMNLIVLGLERTNSNYSRKNYSLRSQYYGKYKTLVTQCLTNLIENKDSEISREEYDGLRSTLSRLLLVMEAKLQLTAEEELQKDRMLYKMFLDNEKFEYKTSELRQERTEGQDKFDDLLNSKLEVIESHRSLIDDATKRTRSYLNTQIYQSENNMKVICEKNFEEIKSIECSLTSAEERLKLVLAQNLHNEQEIRKEKLIVQQNLKKLLDKYDLEVGSRTGTVRQLIGILENEESFLRKLEATCKAQELQYNMLMLQKDTEEKQLQEERMLLFMMNRAARIIQRNWRLVMAKKRLKKGKRGKGKAKKG